MKPDCTMVFAMDGTLLGTAYGRFVTLERWRAIQEIIRDHYKLESWEELDVIEIPEGPMEGMEIVVNDDGEWLACFDLDVVEHFRQAR